MAGAEDGHQDAHAAEDERVEGAAQRPPGAEEEEDEEVHGRGHRGQHDACKNKTPLSRFLKPLFNNLNNMHAYICSLRVYL